MGIVGLLIFIHLAYYPEDIWFIYILLTIGFFAFFGIAGLYLDFFNIGSEAEKKINESDSFIN
jgi:heme/copper-type cytochrome/quinol oxidase subunit 4